MHKFYLYTVECYYCQYLLFTQGFLYTGKYSRCISSFTFWPVCLTYVLRESLPTVFFEKRLDIYRILLVMRTLPWTNTSILDLVSISDTWIAIAPSTCLSATTFLALGVCVFSLYTGNIHFWIHVRFIIYEPYCKRCFFWSSGEIK